MDLNAVVDEMKESANTDEQVQRDIAAIRENITLAMAELEKRAREQRDRQLAESKELKAELEKILERTKGQDHVTREWAIANIKLREVVFWLGQELKELGSIPFSKESKPEPKPEADAADPANMI